MAVPEVLHQIIDTNIKLLNDSGYKIDFEEGMFREPSLPKFEKVGHALLMVLDPVECRKAIPWPLYDDKHLRHEFRRKFIIFIKMINSKYPQANIPEVAASSLHFPSGLNFLQMMFKLSAFAVWLKMTRMSSPKEIDELVHRYQLSKVKKDNIIKINIIRGACQTAKGSLQDVIDYQAMALPLVQKLRSHNEEICSKVLSASKQLTNQVMGLDVDDQTKLRHSDIEDPDVMTDWNARTKKKVAELRHQVGRLAQLRDLTVECRRQKEAAAKRPQDLCLDGAKLSITPTLAELVGGPVYNSRGEVRLTAVLQAGQALAAGLCSAAPASPSLLPEAKEILEKFQTLRMRAANLCVAQETCCDESRKVIGNLRPIVYNYIKQKIAPDHFKYLRARPTLEIVRSCSSPKHESPVMKKEREKRWYEILRQKKNWLGTGRTRVVCSVKRRRSLSLSSLETPSWKRFRYPAPVSTIKQITLTHDTQNRPTELRRPKVAVTSTPACRKSLYGKLPKGSKVQVEEDLSLLPDQSKTALLGLPQEPEATPLQSSRQESINDLIERLNKVKTRMNANKS
uniref:HAUS augmin-like complex subunit 6 N-terminal domain-containing protein n=1 Tax=Graphocephala atropunctata TaxID=36148 RepID=A0A1B6M6W3_9HEMI